jgi:hypothetical protein
MDKINTSTKIDYLMPVKLRIDSFDVSLRNELSKQVIVNCHIAMNGSTISETKKFYFEADQETIEFINRKLIEHINSK